MGTTADFDLVIQGGTVVDGTGLPRRRLDVGVRDGKVAELGQLANRSATDRIDATDMVVAPGIVDAHTHYDPQLTFEPHATTSVYHGVTTVLAGNCGFSIAPCRARDRDFLQGIFAKVESMDPIALSAIEWDFETFDEFLTARKGRLGVNMACYVGHSNLRRWVMGADASTRPATADELDQMRDLAERAIRAGAAGLSSSSAPSHLDGDDRPVPSRLADHAELEALAGAVGRVGTGSITYLPESAIGGLDDRDKELLVRLAELARVPVIIQGLGGRNKVDAPTATWEASKAFLDRATGNGTPVYSILITRPFDRPLTIGPETLHYLAVPSWDRMLKLDHDQRMALLADPAARDELRHAVENYNRDPARGTTVPPPLWRDVKVDRVRDEANKRFESRSIADIAAELDVEPADAILDLARSEDLATQFRWQTESPEWSEAVREAQLDPRMIVGTSDGGAHLARDDGSDWSSYFLRTWVMDRGVWSLEEGIRQITHWPASLLGFYDRGLLQPGRWADIMVFDPDRIAPLRKEFVHDLPGGVGRFKAWPTGVHATIVNGVPVVRDGGLDAAALPGHVVSPVATS